MEGTSGPRWLREDRPPRAHAFQVPRSRRTAQSFQCVCYLYLVLVVDRNCSCHYVGTVAVAMGDRVPPDAFSEAFARERVRYSATI